MFTRQTSRNRGFSLLELVIVVVIIGIIAAIAVPRMSRGAKGADESSLKGSLAVLRNAVDLYAAEHGGTFPSGTSANVIDQLTKYTDSKGAVSATKDAATSKVYGPYLKAVPVMPLGSKKGDDKVVVATEGSPTGAGTEGWWYNSTTGEFRANLPAGEVGDENKPYNSY